MRDPGAVAGIETTQPCGDVFQARGERWNRGGHAAVKADQEQSPLRPGEGVQRRLEQVLRHIVVERPFVVAHRVLVEPATALCERSVQELLRLTTEGALEDHAEAPLQLVLLARDERPVVVCAEDFSEGVDVPEQRARRLHVLHETPQLGERVLHRRGRQQQNRRRAQEAADAVRHQRVLGSLVVDPVSVVTFVKPREDLVRLVDDDQVERGTCAELLGAAFASGELAADQVDTRSGEVRLGLLGLNPKQVEQLVLPLADQRLRDDEEDALGPFGAALRNHQAGFDGLAQARLRRRGCSHPREDVEARRSPRRSDADSDRSAPGAATQRSARGRPAGGPGRGPRRAFGG